MNELERSGSEAVVVLDAVAGGSYQTGVAQLAEMLRYGWLRDGETGGELMDGERRGGEKGKNLPPRGVGDCLEYGVRDSEKSHKDLLMSTV